MVNIKETYNTLSAWVKSKDQEKINILCKLRTVNNPKLLGIKNAYDYVKLIDRCPDKSLIFGDTILSLDDIKKIFIEKTPSDKEHLIEFFLNLTESQLLKIFDGEYVYGKSHSIEKDLDEIANNINNWDDINFNYMFYNIKSNIDEYSHLNNFLPKSTYTPNDKEFEEVYINIYREEVEDRIKSYNDKVDNLLSLSLYMANDMDDIFVDILKAKLDIVRNTKFNTNSHIEITRQMQINKINEI